MNDHDAVMVDAMLEAGAKLEVFEAPRVERVDGCLRPSGFGLDATFQCYGLPEGEVSQVIGWVTRAFLGGGPLPVPVHVAQFESIVPVDEIEEAEWRRYIARKEKVDSLMDGAP